MFDNVGVYIFLCRGIVKLGQCFHFCFLAENGPKDLKDKLQIIFYKKKIVLLDLAGYCCPWT